jgi:hypothetical protein
MTVCNLSLRSQLGHGLQTLILYKALIKSPPSIHIRTDRKLKMNKFSAAALSITLAFGAMLPSMAQTATEANSDQTLMGKVSSGNKSEVTVQFPENQTQTYALEPGLITSMNLSDGSTVNFDRRKLGTITNVSRYGVVVEFADGETESYLLPQEGRATLTFGDRIVVTPDLRLARADNYVLTAADVKVPPSSMMSTSTGTGTMTQPTNSGGSMAPTPTTPAPSEPAATPAEPERTPPSNPTTTSPSSSDPTMPQTPR